MRKTKITDRIFYKIFQTIFYFLCIGFLKFLSSYIIKPPVGFHFPLFSLKMKNNSSILSMPSSTSFVFLSLLSLSFDKFSIVWYEAYIGEYPIRIKLSTIVMISKDVWIVYCLTARKIKLTCQIQIPLDSVSFTLH